MLGHRVRPECTVTASVVVHVVVRLQEFFDHYAFEATRANERYFIFFRRVCAWFPGVLEKRLVLLQFGVKKSHQPAQAHAARFFFIGDRDPVLVETHVVGNGFSKTGSRFAVLAERLLGVLNVGGLLRVVLAAHVALEVGAHDRFVLVLEASGSGILQIVSQARGGRRNRTKEARGAGRERSTSRRRGRITLARGIGRQSWRAKKCWE